jgi:hypothetical protein
MKIDSRPVQWIGAALVLGWAGFIALGLPRIAAAIPNEAATDAGTPVTVGGVTITPSEGWSLPKDVSQILILRKAGTQLTALPPAPATGDAASVIAPLVDPLRQDPNVAWTVGDPQPFTTASGASGAYVVALAPEQFVTNYVVVQDGQAAQVIVTGTDADWTSLGDEILDMVKTVAIAGGGS